MSTSLYGDWRFTVPERCSIARARSPLGARLVNHRDEPLTEDRRLQVVLYDRDAEEEEPGSRIKIAEASGDPWPCCETWGDALTPDAALRLASMLEVAAFTVLNERLDAEQTGAGRGAG